MSNDDKEYLVFIAIAALALLLDSIEQQLFWWVGKWDKN